MRTPCHKLYIDDSFLEYDLICDLSERTCVYVCCHICHSNKESLLYELTCTPRYKYHTNKAFLLYYYAFVFVCHLYV